MEPIILIPDYKERIWGGTKLKTTYNKNIPYKKTGESWEVACHNNGQSIVANGDYKGYTLLELLLEQGEKLVGYTFEEKDKFPLLIKLIDANDNLSVQVHPDDAYAKINENGELGKSEAWIILEVEDGAKLVAGLKKGTDKSDIVKALKDGTVEDILNYVEVEVGDVVNIPAGLVHAIGSGIMLAEVQQNSDTTYRVYDYNRIGLDGKCRELHVEKSLETIDFDGKHSTECVKGYTVKEAEYEHTYYIINQYFALETVNVSGMYEQSKGNWFEVYMVLEGSGVLRADGYNVALKKGDSIMVPAVCNKTMLKGTMKLLKTYVPNDVKETRNQLKEKGIDINCIM